MDNKKAVSLTDTAECLRHYKAHIKIFTFTIIIT